LWANLPTVYREQATFYTDQYEVYTGVIPAAQHKAITKKKPGKPITSSVSITPYDSASLSWCVTREHVPKSWPIISAPSSISSALAIFPGLGHYLYNTTRELLCIWSRRANHW
jgi:hypothetical protein